MLRAMVLFILPLILCVSAQYRQYNADNRVEYSGKSEHNYDATNSQPMYQPRSYIKLPARTWPAQPTEAPIPAPAPAPIQTVSYGPVQVAPQPPIDSPPAPLAKSAHPLEHLPPLLPKPEPDRQPVFIKHYQPTPVQIETKPSPVKVPVQARPIYVPTQAPLVYLPTQATPVDVVQPATRPIPRPLPTRPLRPIPQTIPNSWQRPKQPIIKYVPRPISPALPTPLVPSIQGLPCHDNASIIYVMYGQPPTIAPPQPTVEIASQPSVEVITRSPVKITPRSTLEVVTQQPVRIVPQQPVEIATQPPVQIAPQPPVDILPAPIANSAHPLKHLPTLLPKPVADPRPVFIKHYQPTPVQIQTEPSPVKVPTQAPNIYVPTQAPPVYVPTQPPAPAPTPKYVLTASRPILRPPARPVRPISQPIPSPWQRPKQPIIKYVPGPISPTLPTPLVPSIQGLPCHDNASIIYVMYGQPSAIAPPQPMVEIAPQPPVEFVTRPPVKIAPQPSLEVVTRQPVKIVPQRPVEIATQPPVQIAPQLPVDILPAPIANSTHPLKHLPTLLPKHVADSRTVFIKHYQPTPVQIQTEPSPVKVPTRAPPVYVPTQPPAPAPTPKYVPTASRPILRPPASPVRPISQPIPSPWQRPKQPIIKYIPGPISPTLPTPLVPSIQGLPCHDNASIIYVMYGQPPAITPPQPMVEIAPQPPVEVVTRPPVKIAPQPSLEVVTRQPVKIVPQRPVEIATQPPVQIAPQPPVDILPAPIANSAHPIKHLPTLLPKPVADRRPAFIKHYQPTPVQILTEPSPVKVPTQAPPVYVPTQPPAPAPTLKYVPTASRPILRPPARPVRPTSQPIPSPWQRPKQPIIKYVPGPISPALPTPLVPSIQGLPCHDNASIIYVMYGQPPAIAPPQPMVEIAPQPPVEVVTRPPVKIAPQPSLEVVTRQPVKIVPQRPVEIATQPPVQIAPQAPVDINPAPIANSAHPLKHLPTLLPKPVADRRPAFIKHYQPTPVQILTEPSPVKVPTQAPPVYVPTQPPAPAPTPKYVPTASRPILRPPARPVRPTSQPIPSPWQRPKQPIIKYVPGPISPTLPTPVVPSIQGLPCHDNASIIYVIYGQPPVSKQPAIAPQQPLVIARQPPVPDAQQQPLVIARQPPVPAAPQQPLVIAPQPPVPAAPQQPLVIAPQPPVPAAPQQPSVIDLQPPVPVAPQQPLVIAPQRPGNTVLQTPFYERTQATPVYVPKQSSVPSRPTGSSKLNFACPDDNGFYAIDKECDTYIQCENRIATMQNCPDGLHFNSAAKWNEQPCGYPALVKCAAGSVEQSPSATAQCPRQYGFFSMNDGDCSKYIVCHEGIASIMNCPAGLVFNTAIDDCDWPESVPECNPKVLSDYTCPEAPLDANGAVSDVVYKYRYENQCKFFVACHKGFPRLLSCDPGLAFDEASQSCIADVQAADCNTPTL